MCTKDVLAVDGTTMMKCFMDKKKVREQIGNNYILFSYRNVT